MRLRLALFGDSVIDNSTGAWLSTRTEVKSVRAQLRAVLRARGVELTAHKYAESGKCMADVVNTQLPRFAADGHAVDAAVLSIGGNDLFHAYMQSLGTFSSCYFDFELAYLETLRAVLAAVGDVPVAVINIPTIRRGSWLMNQAADLVVASCNRSIATVVAHFNTSRRWPIGLVDAHALGRRYLITDGIHMDDEGAMIIATEIADFVQKYVK